MAPCPLVCEAQPSELRRPRLPVYSLNVNFAYLIVAELRTFNVKGMAAWLLLSKTMSPANPVASGGLFSPIDLTFVGAIWTSSKAIGSPACAKAVISVSRSQLPAVSGLSGVWGIQTNGRAQLNRVCKLRLVSSLS